MRRSSKFRPIAHVISKQTSVKKTHKHFITNCFLPRLKLMCEQLVKLIRQQQKFHILSALEVESRKRRDSKRRRRPSDFGFGRMNHWSLSNSIGFPRDTSKQSRDKWNSSGTNKVMQDLQQMGGLDFHPTLSRSKKDSRSNPSIKGFHTTREDSVHSSQRPYRFLLLFREQSTIPESSFTKKF